MKTSTYLKIVLGNIKKREIIGNAYSDHDLMDELYTMAVISAQLNAPEVSFEAYNYIGTHVIGVDPMTWEEFVDCLTFWHREVAPANSAELAEEAEARRQEENEDAAWPFGRPQGF